MYLIIDNYDSFTYNLYQYMCEISDEEILVERNDALTLDKIWKMSPKGIIISPGPGRPEDAGISVGVIKEFSGKIPILGVCLGHQAIAFALGGEIVQAKAIVHGKTDTVSLDGKGLFRHIPASAEFTRYHSLAVSPDSLPPDLEITARSTDGEIMGIRHVSHVLEGVQFHPESIASEFGKRILKNFISYQRDPFPYAEYLNDIMSGSDIGLEGAEGFMEELTAGNLTDAQIAGYLTALNAKGIKPEEIAGCVAVLQRKRVPLEISVPVLDTCGTGGDGLGTFNISSFGALIAAACGAKVAKHGNRAVSSKSGSADFYRELGIPVDVSPQQAKNLIEREGFSFLFAPIYHGAMRHAGAARRQLGVKTIMNLLGPLVNPAGASYQLIGVFSADYCMPVARAALMSGIKRVMVVHGSDGLDEISISGPTKVVYGEEGEKPREDIINPEELGFQLRPVEELKGGSAAENALIARDILEGNGHPGIRDVVILNAAAALFVSGTCQSLAEGCSAARDALDSGLVNEKIESIKASAKKG